MPSGSSPHTRGALPSKISKHNRFGIIPAYAGSTAPLTTATSTRTDHPRIRGEHGEGDVAPGGAVGSSPHTRGAPQPPLLAAERQRIIPAYAGSTGFAGISPSHLSDHPRIRGEHSTPPDGTVLDPGSSPHTRGALWRRVCRGRGGGIIPAYAGSTGCGISLAPSVEDHPRIRGEHSGSPGRRGRSSGSSPHTRGARIPTPHPHPQPGIIPAYAGSTRSSPESTVCSVGSSPHTRGARVLGGWRGRRRRIIPAYAGSTCRWVRLLRRSRDHPRIRGEHAGDDDATTELKGSSPHTRGALLGGQELAVGERIIPAYAGSTAHERAWRTHPQDHPRIRGEHDPVGVGDGRVRWIIPAYAGSTYPGPPIR